jgi:hypothetical protein
MTLVGVIGLRVFTGTKMTSKPANNPLRMSDIKQDLSFFPDYEGLIYKSKTACFELIRDIYKEEYGKTFSEDFLSKLKDYNKKYTNPLILDWLEKDFVEVSEPKQGDVVVINTPMFHLGLHVDKGLFFHARPKFTARFGLLSKYKVRSYHRYKGSNS